MTDYQKRLKALYERRGLTEQEGEEWSSKLLSRQRLESAGVLTSYRKVLEEAAPPSNAEIMQAAKALLVKKGFTFGRSAVNDKGWLTVQTDTDESFDRFIEYLRPMGFTPMMRNRSGGGTLKKDNGNQRTFIEYIPLVRVTVNTGPITD